MGRGGRTRRLVRNALLAAAVPTAAAVAIALLGQGGQPARTASAGTRLTGAAVTSVVPFIPPTPHPTPHPHPTPDPVSTASPDASPAAQAPWAW
ncbi:MAG TPA: hypothetical protein VF112_02205 [Candidatus Dormibacteraeota bacterium]